MNTDKNGEKMYQHCIKRILDLFIGIIFLPILLIVIIIVACIIYLDDKGPVFYNAERLGLNGKPFKMYKFRSMKVNAPDIRNADGSTYNSENDPRVTRVGNFLRRSSIDEFPQLINVVLGQMSFIGPRPDPLSDLKIYTEEQRTKLNVRPGITGYNQAYYRNSVSQDEKFEHDVYYSKNLSFLLDVKIFMKTLITVFGHNNIYNNVSAPSEEIQKEIDLLKKRKEK